VVGPFPPGEGLEYGPTVGTANPREHSKA
jgi:hypothetical protein